MIPSQMLKGTLEGCILKVISQKETYGYEISENLRTYGFTDISEGTIYPPLAQVRANWNRTALSLLFPMKKEKNTFVLVLPAIRDIAR